MNRGALSMCGRNVVAILVFLVFDFAPCGRGQQTATLKNEQLTVTVRPQDGSYEIRMWGLQQPVLAARVGAEIGRHWVWSSDYPSHQATPSAFDDALGHGQQVKVTFSESKDRPELDYVLRLYDDLPYGDIQVRVVNRSSEEITVQAIRSLEAVTQPKVNLGGREQADRVLSDSFSEDRPPVRIFDLGQARQYKGHDEFGSAPSSVHFAVGSQLIYNRESGNSLLLAALTSRRWVVLFHLNAEKSASGQVRISSYTVDSTGTTEVEKHESLRADPAGDQIELSLPVRPGDQLDSERLMFEAGKDYHAQLAEYGKAVHVLHHPRSPRTGPFGWWSWTAYYYGLTEATALTNAEWLAQHLKTLGYDYFHIDEGYQYADSEYATPNATAYPNGMASLGRTLNRLGLNFGLWVAPFRVSCRSWVYEHHKEWLVHNAQNTPIQINFVEEGKDPLYVLDTTHPGAQDYLLRIYSTLVREWGVRYFKLDFMDDTAIEGQHYRPNTTAMEAQRLGLETIRKAVGENVLLDKDGSVMLNPVGLVDEGRISLDTGHSFMGNKDAATGIAARYYMNHTFYTSDPDAFSVSRQLIPDQTWHQDREPITLDEAEVSIALAAIAGGMYEIGDDLPTLGADPDRLSLVESRDLLQMVRLQRAAVPLDLMTYLPEDEQPSVFLLKEDKRQLMLAVFNWTEQPRSHAFTLAELRLSPGGTYEALDVFDHNKPVRIADNLLRLDNQPLHSVRLIKIINTSIPAAAPTVSPQVPAHAIAGQAAKFSVTFAHGVPAIACHWDFGDGTSADAPEVSHAYTRAGAYTVRLVVDGVDGVPADNSFLIMITGNVVTEFEPQSYRR